MRRCGLDAARAGTLTKRMGHVGVPLFGASPADERPQLP